MENITDNNKRIAKNTLLLYLRMILTLGVGLFTVRVILNTLGIEDYGIYNVVAGFVTSFSFLANTTSTAIQRFLSFCLGQNKMVEYNKYFTNSFFLFTCLAVISLLILETVGLWFVHEKLIIPEERLYAAIWVFQSAVISLFFSFLSIPYNAVILSNEKMDVFAYVSIFDVVAKLVIVYLLIIIPFDHLKTYAVLFSTISFLDFILYRFYAKKINRNIHVSIFCDIVYLKRLLGFTGWNLIGSISGLFRSQGLNILINLFFGPVYNAARGIAYQIYNAINGFAGNFMMAVNPQIIKLYASNQEEELSKLVMRSSRMSFSLLTLISYPFIVLMPVVLKLWLNETPDVTVLFARLVLVNMLVECISLPLLTLAQATGKLKYYQSIVGGLLILNLPITWIAFNYFDAEAYICFIILILLNVVALIARLLILQKTAKLNIVDFIRNVLLKWLLLMIVCAIGFVLSLGYTSAIQLIFTIFFVCIILPVIILYVVLNSSERKRVYLFIIKKK